MKFYPLLTLALLVFPTRSPAGPHKECHRYEAKGIVETRKVQMRLTLAKGTASEKSLPFSVGAQSKAAPYIGRHVKAVVIGENNKITAVESMALEPYDPLNQNGNSVFKSLGEVQCP